MNGMDVRKRNVALGVTEALGSAGQLIHRAERKRREGCHRKGQKEVRTSVYQALMGRQRRGRRRAQGGLCISVSMPWPG